MVAKSAAPDVSPELTPSYSATLSRQASKYLPALVTFVLVIVIWEGFIRLFNIQRFLLPAPSLIFETFTEQYPKMFMQGGYTFQNALWGYAIGCGLGVLFGAVSARAGGISKALLPYAVAANSIPIIAIAPIANQWFSVDNPASKIVIIAMLCFFPVMINTVRGLTSAPPAMVELMHSYAASELAIFRKLRLPVALPFIFSALKICTSLSMIAAIVSEYFGGPIYWLGVNILSNARVGKFTVVWAQIAVAAIFGLGFYFVVSLVERLVMPWHVSFRNQKD
ncbi:MAG: ABC transporter permease [Anaerolineae bacterium]|nr:ABC transporter permease [Anaerolineae bacterium]